MGTDREDNLEYLDTSARNPNNFSQRGVWACTKDHTTYQRRTLDTFLRADVVGL